MLSLEVRDLISIETHPDKQKLPILQLSCLHLVIQASLFSSRSKRLNALAKQNAQGTA